MRQLFLTLLAALALAAPRASAAEYRNLMAQGTTWPGGDEAEGPLWLVQIVSTTPAQSQTFIRLRERMGDANWIQLPPIAGRVLSITGQSTELIIVLEPASGDVRDWARYSTFRFSYGPPLPNCSILDLAGNRHDLWAIGRPVRPKNSPASRPATAPATQPSTQPAAAPHPILFRLKDDAWQPQEAAWPQDIPFTPLTRLSLAIIGERPTLAVTGSDEAIHLLQFDKNQWTPLQTIRPDGPVRFFKVLSLEQRPALWCQPANDFAGGIYIGQEYRKLALPTSPADPADIDVTVGGHQLRAFWAAKPAKPNAAKTIAEQRFTPNVLPDGQPISVLASTPRSENQIQWFTVAMISLTFLLVLNILLRRRAASPDNTRDDDNSNKE